MITKEKSPLSTLTISLDRDLFLRTLVREMAGVLEDVVGYSEASGYISLMGQAQKNMNAFAGFPGAPESGAGSGAAA